jgi:hypothetical protein
LRFFQLQSVFLGVLCSLFAPFVSFFLPDLHKLFISDSPTLKAIFQNPSQESLSNEVDLSDLPFAAGLEPVFRFMYTGKLDVANHNLASAWRAALYLDLEKAEKELSQRICSLKQQDLTNDEWLRSLIVF